MATDHDPIFGEKEPHESSLPPKLHVETRASDPSRSGSSSGKLLCTLLTSGVLSLLFGGAGAWGLHGVKPCFRFSRPKGVVARGRRQFIFPRSDRRDRG
jgi:hypothetical protein